jgi:Zn-finger domain-containing protein
MFRYRNISSTPQAVSGVGLVEPDKEIETDQEIRNGNFELVEETKKEKPKQTKQ